VTIKDASNTDVTSNYNINYVDNTTSTINQAALTIKANNDARFVTLSDVNGYNGVTYSGFVGGENSSVLTGLLAINRSNASTDVAAGTYSGALVASGLNSNNYNIHYQNGDYTIVAANQLLIRTNNVAMTYGDSLPVYSTTAQYLDGNNNQIATLAQTISGNSYVFTDTAGGSISVALNPYSGSSIASNSSSGHVVVGNYVIQDANPSISGNLNFANSPVFVGALTVNTKAVTPSATNVSKVYDGTTSMANVSVGLSGKVTGDSLSISGIGAFSQKDVGSNLGYTISGVTLSGADASNYHLIGGTNSFSGSDGAITAATLKITTSDVIKTYDRTTQAAGSAIATDGTQLFGTDSLSGGAFTFSDWNAGVGNKVVNVSGVTVNDGNGGNNYAVSYVDNITSTINAKNLMASYSASNKTYDGNSTASVTGSSSDVISGDMVSFANTNATFNSKDVGVGKAVTVSGISIGGADAGNYVLQNTTAATGADISKKDVTLAGITATSRAYDGTDAATITAGAIATGVSGETLAISGTGTFSDKNVATGKTVTVADVTALSKANGTGDWSNYNLITTGSITTLADITQAALTLTSSDVTKTYDGTLTALGTASILSGTLFAGDSLTGGSFAFTDKNFGVSNKVVTVGGVTVGDGTHNGNYLVSYVNNTSSTINRATLSAGLTGTVEKVYDGLTSANNLSNSNFSITGWAGVEGATVNQTLGSYLSPNVSANAGMGNVSAVLASSHFVANSGTDLNNYNLPSLASGFVGKITPASLTVKVNDTAAFVTQDPNTAVDNGLSYTGFKNGETAATALGAIGTRVYTGASNPVAGSYADVYELSATPTANHGNYTVSVAKGALTVIPADKLLINIASKSETYGVLDASNAGASASTVTAQYCFVAGGNCTGSNIVDLTMTNLGNGSWKATDNTNTSVTFSTLIDSNGHLSAGGFLNAGNYTYDATTTTPNITSNFNGRVVNGGVLTVQAKALTLSANNVTKVYDGHTNIGLTRLSTDKMTGDDVTATANNGVFDSKNAGTRQVTLNGISLSGADQNNYSISTAPLAGSGSISAKAVTLTAPSITKSYDGLLTYSTSANDLNALSAQLGVVGDSVTNATLTYTDKNAGTNKSVTLDSYVINDGNYGQNYSVSLAGNNTSTITKASANVIVTANSDLTKVYNGGNQTVTGFTATGFVNGETDAVLTGVSASGTGKNVGTYNVTASGADNNYNLMFVNGSLIIDQAILQLHASDVTKVYDGTTLLAGIALTPSGVFLNDQVAAVANTGNFVSKDVGDSIGFTLSGLTLSGSSAGNYRLQNPILLGTGSITPKRLTLIGSLANNKVFDGNVSASIVPGILNGLVGQETLDLSVSGAFFDPAVGDNKAVMARYSLKNGHYGGLASNYVLDDELLSASITGFPQVINPVPVNPSYKTPDTAQLVNEKVTVTGNTQAVTEKVMVSDQNQQSTKKDQQACVKDFSAECGSGQESLAGKPKFAHHYDTFY
jgi:hypothetical protein